MLYASLRPQNSRFIKKTVANGWNSLKTKQLCIIQISHRKKKFFLVNALINILHILPMLQIFVSIDERVIENLHRPSQPLTVTTAFF